MYISPKFRNRQGVVYEAFGKEQCPGFDYSEGALVEFFLHESQGKPTGERNGYTLGKKMAGIAIDQWEQDIRKGLLHLSEIESAFQDHEWFLKDIRERVAKFEQQRRRQGKSFSYGLVLESLQCV